MAVLDGNAAPGSPALSGNAALGGSSMPHVVSGGFAQDVWWEWEVIDQDRSIPGSQSTVTLGDMLIQQTTSATVKRDKLVRIEHVRGTPVAVTFGTSNAAIGSPASDGVVTHGASDGEVNITLTSSVRNDTVPLNLITLGGQATQTLQGGVAGSVRQHVTDFIDAALAGKDPANAKTIFSTYNVGGVYVRNPNCWLNGFDLTPLSPWNSAGGKQMAGTLISPRHVVFAEHYQYAVGTVLHFVKMDGTVVTRTLTAKVSIGPANNLDGYDTDMVVGLLDSDVPEGISFARVLPVGWENYFFADDDWAYGEGMPVVGLDQEEKALVDMVGFLENGAWYQAQTPNKALWSSFHENKISGDSGNIEFIPINGYMVMLTTWTYGGAGSGPAIHGLRSLINAAMTTLGGGYQLTEIPLGAFVDFSGTANPNLLAHSGNPNHADWAKNSVGVGHVPGGGPDGGDAFRVEEIGSTSSIRYIRKTVTGTHVGLHTASCYFKAAEIGSCSILVGDSPSASNYAYVTWTIGAAAPSVTGIGWAAGTAAVTNAGDGWYRLSYTFTTDSGTADLLMDVRTRTSGTTMSTNGQGMLVWGPQLEAGALTPYRVTDRLGTDRNLVQHSQATNLSPWGNAAASVTADEVLAPDGTLTGDRLVNANGGQFTYRTQSISGLSGSYTCSAYFKYGNSTSVHLQLRDFTANVPRGSATINPQSPTTGTSVVAVGGGWYRVSFTATGLVSGNNNQLICYPTGVGAPAGILNGYTYVWGFQVEAGTNLTPYEKKGT